MLHKLFLSGELKNFIKPRILVYEGTIFRLHYQVTTLLICACSLLLSATQLFGDPIQCIQTDDVPATLLDTYCWIEGTFSLPKAFDKKVGVEVVYQGVDQRDPGDDIIVHAYYQWVVFMLFFQALLFYLPRFVWKCWEGHRIRNLIQELNTPVVPFDEKKKRYENLVRYFRANMRHHSSYAFRYFLCECMTLINVIGQIFFIDAFLGGEFSTYGIKVLEFATTRQEDRIDPMIRVFPRMTKCTFHRYGSSGDVQKYDALCLLPLNIVNEKIYILLWFWFILLSILTCFAVLYRIILIGWPRLRYLILGTVARFTPREQLKKILNRTTFGDWFVIFLLGKNMDAINYKEFLHELVKNLESPATSNENSEKPLV